MRLSALNCWSVHILTGREQGAGSRGWGEATRGVRRYHAHEGRGDGAGDRVLACPGWTGRTGQGQTELRGCCTPATLCWAGLGLLGWMTAGSGQQPADADAQHANTLGTLSAAFCTYVIAFPIPPAAWQQRGQFSAPRRSGFGRNEFCLGRQSFPLLSSTNQDFSLLRVEGHSTSHATGDHQLGHRQCDHPSRSPEGQPERKSKQPCTFLVLTTPAPSSQLPAPPTRSSTGPRREARRARRKTAPCLSQASHRKDEQHLTTRIAELSIPCLAWSHARRRSQRKSGSSYLLDVPRTWYGYGVRCCVSVSTTASVCRYVSRALPPERRMVPSNGNARRTPFAGMPLAAGGCRRVT